MVVDIERVLPKLKYGDFMFKLFNLSVSCKRCNMKIKCERIDLLLDKKLVSNNPEDSSQYILRPNLDNYFQNMRYNV